MSYADEMGRVFIQGVTDGWIKDVTKMEHIVRWLHHHPDTVCPTCAGAGGMMVALNDAQPGEMIWAMAVPCPQCSGVGEVPYTSAN